MVKFLSASVLILAVSSTCALAGEGKCSAIDVPKHIIADHGGHWIELAPAQWQFLRGIYAGSPATPPTLPVGDRAALAQVDGASFGMVFFLDGDRACTPMIISRDVVEMLRDVGAGEIKHLSDGL